jgi:C4-dicarboxylate-specific signal transduction histidine kinase
MDPVRDRSVVKRVPTRAVVAMRSAASHDAPLRGVSIATKFRVVVFVLAAILVLICGVVFVQVRGIRLDMERVAEERREAEQASAVLLDIEGFRRWVAACAAVPALAAEPFVRTDQRAHLDGALAAFSVMTDEPRDDPSRVSHELREEASRRNLHELLLQARQDMAAADESATARLYERAHQMHALASTLHHEMRQEARLAALDLDQRGSTVQRQVTLLAAIAFLVLGLVCVFLVRGIVRPLRVLAAGTRALGRGQGIVVLPQDGGAEVSDLAREITAMAQQLDGHKRELQQRVEQRTRELIRSARLADLGAVAAGLAHEINNPLASIVACADGLHHRLARGLGDVAAHSDDLRTIAREAERVREITTRLLEIARPGSDELGPVQIDDAVRTVVTLVRHRFAQAGVHLRVECAPDLPPVRSNEQELRQVLLNLLTNALDASGRSGRVSLTAVRAGSEVVVDVDDTGAGVPLELVDKIFDPFFTTKRAGQGTGLGLTIVQRILERHGGHVEVAHLQPGARFRVRLPLAAA